VKPVKQLRAAGSTEKVGPAVGLAEGAAASTEKKKHHTAMQGREDIVGLGESFQLPKK